MHVSQLPLTIWEIDTGECLQTLRGHSKAVYTVILCGDKLISGSSDNTIKVWAPEPDADDQEESQQV